MKRDQHSAPNPRRNRGFTPSTRRVWVASTALALGLAAAPAQADPPQDKTRPKLTRALNSKIQRARTIKTGPKPKAKARTRPRTIPRVTKPRPLPNPYKEACHGVERLTRRAGPSPFPIGEELGYDLTVAGALVGRMELKVGKPRQVEGQTRIPLFGRARTSAFLAAFKAFEGRYMSMVTPGTLAPLGARVESKYGEDNRWERIHFGQTPRSVAADVLLQGRELRREYDSEHDLTDLLTLLYQARTVAVQPGLKACQDVFASRRLWRMTADVESIEEIDTLVGKKPAYVVRTVFDRKPTHGLNNHKRPSMEVDIYLATDAAQTPLQFVVRSQGVEAKGQLVRWSIKGGSADADWTF